MSPAAASSATSRASCRRAASAELDWDSWERPPVFAWLTEQGVDEEEQRRVFNLGIGMCAVVPAADAGAGQVIGRIT